MIDVPNEIDSWIELELTKFMGKINDKGFHISSLREFVKYINEANDLKAAWQALSKKKALAGIIKQLDEQDEHEVETDAGDNRTGDAEPEEGD